MKRYQLTWIDDGIRSVPVIADFGEEGPETGKFASTAYAMGLAGDDCMAEPHGYDPADTIRWGAKSLPDEEFDDLDEALDRLREVVEERFDRVEGSGDLGRYYVIAKEYNGWRHIVDSTDDFEDALTLILRWKQKDAGLASYYIRDTVSLRAFVPEYRGGFTWRLVEDDLL